jgi:exosome complex component CSL4
MMATTSNWNENSFVIPGDYITNSNDFTVGHGAYIIDDVIRSSLCGKVFLQQGIDGRKIISVSPSDNSKQNAIQNSIIKIGDNVSVRVTKVNYNQAFVDILFNGTQELIISSKGVIRREDVKSTEIDKVNILEYFKPSMIVNATVISLGDNKHYFLSTAENKSLKKLNA